jgi:hypothetical protein
MLLLGQSHFQSGLGSHTTRVFHFKNVFVEDMSNFAKTMSNPCRPSLKPCRNHKHVFFILLRSARACVWLVFKHRLNPIGVNVMLGQLYVIVSIACAALLRVLAALQG